MNEWVAPNGAVVVEKRTSGILLGDALKTHHQRRGILNLLPKKDLPSTPLVAYDSFSRIQESLDGQMVVAIGNAEGLDGEPIKNLIMNDEVVKSGNFQKMYFSNVDNNYKTIFITSQNAQGNFELDFVEKLDPALKSRITNLVKDAQDIRHHTGGDVVNTFLVKRDGEIEYSSYYLDEGLQEDKDFEIALDADLGDIEIVGTMDDDIWWTHTFEYYRKDDESGLNLKNLYKNQEQIAQNVVWFQMDENTDKYAYIAQTQEGLVLNLNGQQVLKVPQNLDFKDVDNALFVADESTSIFLVAAQVLGGNDHGKFCLLYLTENAQGELGPYSAISDKYKWRVDLRAKSFTTVVGNGKNSFELNVNVSKPQKSDSEKEPVAAQVSPEGQVS